MYNNKRNAPSWPFLLSVIVSDVSDLNKSFPSCPWASPSIWLDVEVINLTWLSWEQLWHHRWSLNFTTGQNKWVWWPVRRESLCLSQSQAYPGWPRAQYPQSPPCRHRTAPGCREPPWELSEGLWGQGNEALSAGPQGWKTKEERESAALPQVTGRIWGRAQNCALVTQQELLEMLNEESEPVPAYQFLEVFPKLSSKHAKGNRAWDKLKHCCKPFKWFKISLPSRKVCFRNLLYHMWGEVFHGSIPMFFPRPRIPSVAFKEQQPNTLSCTHM